MSCPPGTMMSGGRCIQRTNAGSMGGGSGYQRGGRVARSSIKKRKFQEGGPMNQLGTRTLMNSQVNSNMQSKNALNVGIVGDNVVGNKKYHTKGGPGGHQHTMLLDNNQDGWTDRQFNSAGKSHSHRVKHGVVELHCDGTDCHSHQGR